LLILWCGALDPSTSWSTRQLAARSGSALDTGSTGLPESFGAELVEFAPVRDRELPSVDGVYIGGGYPELHARRGQQRHARSAA